jgi:hypothetical protein
MGIIMYYIYEDDDGNICIVTFGDECLLCDLIEKAMKDGNCSCKLANFVTKTYIVLNTKEKVLRKMYLAGKL